MNDQELHKVVETLLARLSLANLLSLSETKALLDVIESSGLKEIDGQPLRAFFSKRRREHQRQALLRLSGHDKRMGALVQQEMDRYDDVWNE